MRIDPDDVATLASLGGYSEREARFVYVVAAHSGHFLRRHFTRFIEGPRGGCANDFIKKAVDNRHVHIFEYGTGVGHRYHLYARGVYRALGKESSSHRKHGSDTKVGVCLTALDFVLDHLEADYLEDEAAKVAFFTERLGVPLEQLPAKAVEPPRGAAAGLVRYFPDNFPLLVRETESGEPSVTFTYIDLGLISVGTFSTHLRNYKPLLAALRIPARLVFISTVPASFRRAAAVFDAELGHRPEEDRELLEFFRVRSLWDEGQVAQYAPRDFVTRARGLRRYATPQHEDLYRRWLDQGKLLLPPTSSASDNALSARIEFSTYFAGAARPEPAQESLQ